MEKNGNKLIFSTGKEIDPYQGIIGINEELDITEGYDGYIKDTQCPEMDELTNNELIELADYVIKLWQKFKKNIRRNK